MLSKAIDKIRDEMVAHPNNSYVQAVGAMLLQHIEANPASADNILADGKTIAKSYDIMRREAEKKKSGNCAVLSDQEGFAVVLKYFDLKGTMTPRETIVVSTPRPAPVDFDIKLDDLLGG